MRTMNGSVLAAFIGCMILAGCSDPQAPNPDQDNLGDERILAGAMAGQASMPGLLMDGSGDPARQPACSFVAASGRFECTPQVHNGITVVRSYALYDEAGNVFNVRTPAVYSMNTRLDVSGTTAHPDGETTIQRSSDMTVTGLTQASPTRTFNGVETGTMSSVRPAPQGGTITMRHEFEAATTDVVISADRVRYPYPLSGTVSNSSTMFMVLPGGLESEMTSSEVLTFNGTNLVSMVITRFGETRNCMVDLRPRGPGDFPGSRMICS